MMQSRSIPCSLIRGGTSKGLFLHGSYLPESLKDQNDLYLRLMGSPDPRQIDGLGGADPLTSKVVAVFPSTIPGMHIEYDSVEVGVNSGCVNRGIMCGNLSAGVGYFALSEGMVTPTPGMTVVNMFCRSNRKTVVARIPTMDGWPTSVGDFSIQGVPGSAAEVELTFNDPVGTVSESLFPLGKVNTDLNCPAGGFIKVSVIDAGALYAFFRAEDFGLSGLESAKELDGHVNLRGSIEWARATIACRLTQRLRTKIEPRRVKCAIVSRVGETHPSATVVARIINAERAHQAYAVGGAICTAVAAMTENSIVSDVASPVRDGKVTIAHPGGDLCLRVDGNARDSTMSFESATVSRTARILMRGCAYHDG